MAAFFTVGLEASAAMRSSGGEQKAARIRCFALNQRHREFASSSLRQTVWHVSIRFGEVVKSARGARFTRGGGTRECHRPRLSAEMAQNSLFAISVVPSASRPTLFSSPTLRTVRPAEAHSEGSFANASPQSPTARRQPLPADRTAQADDNPDCGLRVSARPRRSALPIVPVFSSIAHPPHEPSRTASTSSSSSRQ
jgi:hypothetical protein